MKNLKKILIGGAIIVGAIALKPSGHVGPADAYPSPSLTPGVVATTDYAELTKVSACGTYSQCHRLTTQAMKDAVCKEYPQNCTGSKEIDHFCPLALGCADDIRNLWVEPEDLMVDNFEYGFHTKDRLEAQLILMMKAKKITPVDAQKCILDDWVACYKKVIGSGNILGAVTIDPDNE